MQVLYWNKLNHVLEWKESFLTHYKCEALHVRVWSKGLCSAKNAFSSTVRHNLATNTHLDFSIISSSNQLLKSQTRYIFWEEVAGMAVLSGISIQTKADKDPGLVYACLVYQRASVCQEYLALTRQLAYHISHLLWLFYNRTVGIKCRFCMLKQIHVNLRNRISSPRLEPHNESTFLKSTSNAPSLPLVACSETRLSQKWSSTVWSSLCLPVLVV